MRPPSEAEYGAVGSDSNMKDPLKPKDDSSQDEHRGRWMDFITPASAVALSGLLFGVFLIFCQIFQKSVLEYLTEHSSKALVWSLLVAVLIALMTHIFKSAFCISSPTSHNALEMRLRQMHEKTMDVLDPRLLPPKELYTLSDETIVILQAVLTVIMYYGAMVLIFVPFTDEWDWNSSGSDFVDALYFASVTISTVGYGDVLPTTDFTQGVVCVLMLVGLTFIMYNVAILSEMWIQKEGENMEQLVGMFQSGLLLDQHNLRLSDQSAKRCQTIAVAIIGIAFNVSLGAFVFHVFEGHPIMDSIYGSLAAITTVGYGDVDFQLLETRVFAVFWLLFAPLSTVKLFGDIVSATMNIEGKMAVARVEALEAGIVASSLEIDQKSESISDTKSPEPSDQQDSTETQFVLKKLHSMKLIDDDVLRQAEALSQTWKKQHPEKLQGIVSKWKKLRLLGSGGKAVSAQGSGDKQPNSATRE